MARRVRGARVGPDAGLRHLWQPVGRGARPATTLPAAVCPLCEGALVELDERAARRPRARPRGRGARAARAPARRRRLTRCAAPGRALDEAVQDLVDDDRPHDEDDQRDDALDPDQARSRCAAVVVLAGAVRTRTGRRRRTAATPRACSARACSAAATRCSSASRSRTAARCASTARSRSAKAASRSAMAFLRSKFGRGALVERLVARVERGRALVHGGVALLDDRVVVEVRVGLRLVARRDGGVALARERRRGRRLRRGRRRGPGGPPRAGRRGGARRPARWRAGRAARPPPRG